MSKIEEALEKAISLREPDKQAKPGKMSMPVKGLHAKFNNHCIVTINEPDSPVAEEYRRLKSVLLRETKADFLNTIMVTSSIESEGKSVTSINLAVTLAQELDHTILLVDADLRRPMIHEYLGVEAKYGLSDYLSGDIELSEILVRTGIGNLVLLPAGSAVENPVELLSSDKMKSLVQELKKRYSDRYVIIDTPPVLSCAEGITIGSYVDGVVFVIEEGRAQKKAIEDALNLMKGQNILGVVFNDVKSTSLDSSYARYYYKYRKVQR